MQLTVDLDNKTFLAGDGTLLTGAISLKRAPVVALEVTFVESGAVVELPDCAIGTLILKPLGKFSSAPLSMAPAWEKQGNGAATTYLFTFSLNTDPIASAFSVSSKEPSMLNAMLELVFNRFGYPEPSMTLQVNVLNNILREADTTPDALPSLGRDGASAYQIAVANGFQGSQYDWLASLAGATASQAEAEAGTDNSKRMTPLRTFQSIAAWISSNLSLSWSAITGKPSTFPPSSHSHGIGEVTGLTTALGGKQDAGSYAPLVNGLVPASVLPSFVDDVVERAAVSGFPTTGESGKIYLAVNSATPEDPSKVYRWSGSSYVEIVASPGSTDAIPEGATNKYFTPARAAAASPLQEAPLDDYPYARKNGAWARFEGVNPFNQSLNRADSAMFAQVTASTFKGYDGPTNAYGSPGSVGGKIYLDGSKRGDQADGDWIAGTPGSIDLRGGDQNDADDTGNGGSLIMRGGIGSGSHAGSIDTSAGWGGTPGGSITTKGDGFPGGYIDTSNGGGFIDTRGTGVICLGSPSLNTATYLIGTATSNRFASFPDWEGTIMVAPSGFPVGMGPMGDFTASSLGVDRQDYYAATFLNSGAGYSSYLRVANTDFTNHAHDWYLGVGSDIPGEEGWFAIGHGNTGNRVLKISADERLMLSASNVQVDDWGGYFSNLYSDNWIIANNGLQVNAYGLLLQGGLLSSDGSTLYFNGAPIIST